MKLGYLTKFTPEESKRARKLGFDCLEIHSQSWSDKIYADNNQRQQILDDLKRAREQDNVTVSAIAHYGPGLSLQGDALADSFKKGIDLAQATGAGVLTTIAARTDRNKSIADNIPAF